MVVVQNYFSSTSCYRYENIDDKSDDALLFLSRPSFLPRRSSFCASPVGGLLPDRRVSVCVCVCARKTPREEEEEEEEEEDVRLCQCRLILKAKEMQKDDAKKKEKSLSLYQTVFVQTGDERGRGKKNDQSGRDARVVHADFFISQRGRGGGCHRRWWWWWW